MTLFQVPNQTSGSNIPCGFKATAKSMKVVLDSLEFSLGTGRKGPEGFVEIVSGRHRPSVIWSSHCLTSDLSTWGLAFSPLGTVSQMKRLLCNHYSICVVVTKGMRSRVWSKCPSEMGRGKVWKHLQRVLGDGVVSMRETEKSKGEFNLWPRTPGVQSRKPHLLSGPWEEWIRYLTWGEQTTEHRTGIEETQGGFGAPHDWGQLWSSSVHWWGLD